MNKKLAVYEGKVECPRCNDGGGGFIYNVLLGEIKKNVYICDECESLWENPEQITHGFIIDFPTYIENHGYTYSTVGMQKTNYYWYHLKEKPD